ncbi:IS3 family transposase [Candidatus Enterococcus mansonii]|uniref:IS3 family transposase n=1 Tax=Candidatus Enterococcus mansonii TaxID=1834181 RepID=UPI000A34B5D2|nr:IS3 family transposase [Enterococcus sp. 4G2_DIV0659]
MDNFFGLMTQEIDYGRSFSSFEELKQGVTKYIDYYKHHRTKVKLTGMSPVQYRIHTSQIAG